MLIVRAPFRISFFGGGTDFRDYYTEYGGQVLSTAIDKFCYVTLRSMPPYFDYENQFTYSKIERFNDPSEVKHPLVRAALRFLPVERVQIAYDADLPARSGLGSSSSFAVALLQGLHTMRGEPVKLMRLAEEAIYVERELCGESGGVQDQLAAAFGGLNRITFGAEGFTVRPIKLSGEKKRLLERDLLLVFTGFTHFSGMVSEEQQRNIASRLPQLHEMKSLVDEGIALLERGDLPAFGRLLDHEWQLKRTLSSKISTPAIDHLYRSFLEAGAVGGKLLGAGNGGYFLLYVPYERQSAFREEFSDLQFVPFSFEPTGVRTIYENSI